MTQFSADEIQSNRELLVDALLRGGYRQGIGRLCNGVNPNVPEGEWGYCCLGVACDVYAKETGEGSWFEVEDNRYFRINTTDSYTHYPPEVVVEYFGLHHGRPEEDSAVTEKMVELNDEQNRSFTFIAGFVEGLPLPEGLE